MLHYRVEVKDDRGDLLEDFPINERDHAEIIGKMLKFIYKHYPSHSVTVAQVDEDNYIVEVMDL